ncbi:hypothetical protein H0H93_014454 [Arthromyces matolae]|nr:hypothetical protein H0H93_014454 [Arthromyces matolae]
MHFTTLTSAIVLALSMVTNGSPTDSFAGYQTLSQFNEWLSTTDADVTFIGEPISKAGGVTPDSQYALDTIVTYCSKRSGNICGGACTVYNGGAACLSAPKTNCLSATNNVAFCDHGNCGGSCNNFATCGTRLDNGFCWTPGTNSINVGTQ